MPNINFTPFPTLTTDRLTLRQLSMADQQHIFKLRSDEAINKYLDRDISRTLDDAITFIEKIKNNVENNISIYWVITLTSAGTFAGTIGLFNFSIETNSCEIGYELLTAFQGNGIMKEAAEKVIAYAFNELQVDQIAACSHKGNQQSTNLLMKLNFTKSIEADNENPVFNTFTVARSK
ncbi:MAG TPA: GNAT family N-acetyltransferase [Flavitalea sp.]|nr:GNAT family N-acetyltransferase [Flavitalea sp.]